MSDLTHILSAMERGDPSAAEQLLSLVYDELRKLTAQRLAQEKSGQTLQAAAIVHDAYVRKVASSQSRSNAEGQGDNRGKNFAAAAEAMRRIFIEQARRKATAKAVGHLRRVDLSDIEPAIQEAQLDILPLHRLP